ncbi:MAG: hypothetical protein ABR573_04445 [Candidatus Dormibacteria bacterium]
MSIGVLFRLARSLPKSGRLVYCLYRDPRTPRWWKIGLGVVLFAVWVPAVPLEWIPVLGQMEWVALTLLALRFSVGRAPRELVEEHEAAIEAGTSLFHQDVNRLRGRTVAARSDRVS